MSGLILAIRPEPGCSSTVEAGRRIELAIQACPLFEIRPVEWTPSLPDEIDALLLGSANAVRHGGALLETMAGKPVYAVGETTARTAEQAGFAVASVGKGQLQDLLDTLVGPLRLLRLTGAEHVSLTPPPSVTIATQIAYEAVPLPMPDSVARGVRSGALVLLHSAAAARHFSGECDRQGIPRDALRLATLGPRISAAAGYGWAQVLSAAEPSEEALLALAREMCHEPRGG